MKTPLHYPSLLLVSLIVFASCQRDLKDIPAPPVLDEPSSILESTLERNGIQSLNTVANPYSISLSGPTAVNGNWEWIWKVQNTNPGNGNSGTVQNLSHWGFVPGVCLTTDAIVSASVSHNGNNWTNFNPSIQVDPSQSCLTTPVLKFDFGTNGNAPTYYKLVLNINKAPGMVTGYYKSGRKTGCGTFSFMGISCNNTTGGFQGD